MPNDLHHDSRPHGQGLSRHLLAGKVAIVTGASAGIGRAIAALFAAEGASVVATARRQAELDNLIAAIESDGGRAVALAGDVTDPALADRLVETALERFGGLDIAVNNAGIVGALAPIHDITPARWRETLDVNLTSAFLMARAQIPAMLARGGGSLVFVSSFVGHTAGLPGMADYAASKAGLIGLTQVLAASYGAQGVRVNALLPGGTDTAMNPANSPGAAPEVAEAINSLHALNRIAEPAEIARSALYLASGLSSFVTGTAHLADGGVSIFRA